MDKESIQPYAGERSEEKSLQNNEEMVPPQYKGMSSEAVEEVWTVPEYIDDGKTRAEKEKKEKAIAYLREQEARAEASKKDLESARSSQETEDAGKIEEIRKKINENGESFGELANVKACREILESKMASQIGDKYETYRQAIYSMLTTRSEFASMEKEAGGNLFVIREKYKKEAEEYKNEFLPAVSSEAVKNGMSWESNPAWTGINTRPEAGKREGINFKSYFTVPMNEHTFVKSIPDLAKRLRSLAVETDDIIQVKVPSGLVGFMSHNDSIVIHCKKQENAEKSLDVVREWMSQNGISELPREMGRTQLAADGKAESFSEMVSKNISKWLVDNEGKYDSKVLAEQAIEHAIRFSQKPPNVG